MSGPAYVPQGLWRGDDTPPLAWGFGAVGASEIPQGAQFHLEIAWLAAGGITGTLTATSPDDGLVVDQVNGTVTWSYTAAQSAAFPLGAVVRYQLRCLATGHTQVWAYGEIRVRGRA